MVEDRYGNTVTSYNGAATLTDSLAGSLASPARASFSKGVLTLTGVTLKKSGSQTLAVASGAIRVSSSVAVSPTRSSRNGASAPASAPPIGTPVCFSENTSDRRCGGETRISTCELAGPGGP